MQEVGLTSGQSHFLIAVLFLTGQFSSPEKPANKVTLSHLIEQFYTLDGSFKPWGAISHIGKQNHKTEGSLAS